MKDRDVVHTWDADEGAYDEELPSFTRALAIDEKVVALGIVTQREALQPLVDESEIKLAMVQ